LQLDGLAVAKPRGSLEVGRPLGPLGLDPRFLDASLELPDPSDDLLFTLPASLERVAPLGKVRQRLVEQPKALARSLVLLLLQRLPLDLELPDLPLQLVELDRHRVDLHAQPGRGLVDQVD